MIVSKENTRNEGKEKSLLDGSKLALLPNQDGRVGEKRLHTMRGDTCTEYKKQFLISSLCIRLTLGPGASIYSGDTHSEQDFSGFL